MISPLQREQEKRSSHLYLTGKALAAQCNNLRELRRGNRIQKWAPIGNLRIGERRAHRGCPETVSLVPDFSLCTDHARGLLRL